MARDFHPWDDHYAASSRTLAVGLLLGWLSFFFGHPIFAILACVIAIILAWDEYDEGRRREYGVDVEIAAVASLDRHLAPLGYRIAKDLEIDRLGNIDATVKSPSHVGTFVVEIKSYGGIVRRWPTNLLTKAGRWKLALLRREPEQVRKQCRYLRRRDSDYFFPVLWCPASHLHQTDVSSEILLVNGDFNLLRTALDWYHDNVKHSVMVKFERMPTETCRQELKDRQFKWNPRWQTWFGDLTLSEFATLTPVVTAQGGKLSLQNR